MKKKLKNTIIFTSVLYLVLQLAMLSAFAFYWLTYNPIQWSESARGAFSLISIILLIFAVLAVVLNVNED